MSSGQTQITALNTVIAGRRRPRAMAASFVAFLLATCSMTSLAYAQAAEGTENYKYFTIDPDLKEDVWVSMAEAIASADKNYGAKEPEITEVKEAFYRAMANFEFT